LEAKPPKHQRGQRLKFPQAREIVAAIRIIAWKGFNERRAVPAHLTPELL
jgi:hypothetical protein